MDERIAYFDNAATTFPKPACVYDFADSFYRSSGGSIGRGGNALAIAAGEIARQAKCNLRDLLGCSAREIVFTASATDALNRILLGLDVADGDHVYLSPFEHNAATRPLNHLAKTKGIIPHILPFDKSTLLPDVPAIEEAFERQTPKLVVLNHASNVCGAIVPVSELCQQAKRHSATTVVDMSQTAGLLPLALKGPEIDFAVFAGHKTLYAPFGIGGFICQRGAELNPVIFGGNGVNSMEQGMPKDIVQMQEVGSQNSYAIAGLKASTEWILKQGTAAIRIREAESTVRLIELLERFENINIVGKDMLCQRIGVVSVNFDGYSPDEVEMVLGTCGIAVRSGIQCSPYAHSFLGTAPLGTVRFSVSALTNDADFEMLENALEYIEENG